jgi:hypothetical protein
MVYKKFGLVVYTFLGLLFFYACGNTKETVDTQKGDLISVTIKATKTTSYCGGAKPTPEIEMEHRKKKIYANATLYIRKGELNNYTEDPVIIVETDSNGIVNLALPKGNYTVVFDNKANQETFDSTVKRAEESLDYRSINEECLKRFFKKPDGSFIVTDSVIDAISINRHFNCPWAEIPCAQFVGDLPPSTRE